MEAEPKEAEQAADLSYITILEEALVEGALPDEIEGFGEEERREAARFVGEAMQQREPGKATVRLESIGGEIGRRRMRICVVNDDMPFLVDSVAAAIAARDLIIHRLLHPVVCAERDADGWLTAIKPDCGREARESLMYIELDRTDARGRNALLAELHDVLADVRAAVRDWRTMQARMHADADALEDAEGSALLHWFADGAMTLLGYEVERPGQPASERLGLFSISGAPTDEGGSAGAIAHFQGGGAVPLVAKADRKSSVHRRVPLDLVVVPVREGDNITGIGVHVGLWTSQALNAPVEDVPLLRRRLRELEQELGFDPQGHSGKALRHAISSLPRDLLINLDYQSVKDLAMVAMSLADRPRPTLVFARSLLKGHLFAFVWLPRDELSTRRRNEIADMIGAATHGNLSSWSVELGEGDLALVRYTFYVSPATPTPDAVALDRRLDEMVRGWKPRLEEALGEIVGPARATRLVLTHGDVFPDVYRSHTDAREAALDVVRINGLADEDARDARLYRKADDGPDALRLKTYRLGEGIPLSEAVPVFENFGFRVIEEQATPLNGGKLGYIHDFALEMPNGGSAGDALARAAVVERSIAAVLGGQGENDPFNQLLVGVGLEPRDIVLFRAWFRYLRQTGLSYSLVTVVDALRHAPDVARGLVALFDARHDPALGGDRQAAIRAAERAIKDGLAKVAAIDEDRILRLIRGFVDATLRTNAFAESGREALAFKLDSSLVPNLPAPVPWREIWVYSPRIEGIHLRGGPVARGGLRWSDRRDDFRTEILGLLKAQVVKNAVIVPTGAKGGFYAKQLPSPSDRDAWLKEGTESYRIFIRALLSVTDNLVGPDVVHPENVTILDGNDPYFVVAADKGTASFSDVANAIATSRNFWLGDAFASGGSHGYDHKGMGITARGAWISVQRHFAEMGIDVQTQSVRAVGCGDMSGDVFGNGMLLSKAIKLVAAYDHRHIFIDPDPDPAKSWEERNRLFHLPRSSWDDYDKALISKGGGVFPRTQKSIPLTSEMRALLGVEAEELDPTALISAILKAPVDLLWFGGIGTYIKARSENNAEVGDPGNDALRVNGADLRVKVVGEGANLGCTQLGRIEFAQAGGRINTDFIDNSAGVDCSDNEVNIKIALNREMIEGRLGFEDRNALLHAMTDEVAAIVLEDNRLQTLALSIAERGGAAALPQMVRAIEILEESGRLNRAVERLQGNDELLRRAQENRGLTRPELAVLLSTTKMALQAAIEAGTLTEDPTLTHELCEAFPKTMQDKEGDAIVQHRLRKEIIATKIANRFVNRLGITAPFSLTEEEGVSLGHASAAFVAAERLFDMEDLWQELETLDVPEQTRLELFDQASQGLQLHIADTLRNHPATAKLQEIVETLRPGLDTLTTNLKDLLRDEARSQSARQRAALVANGAPEGVAGRIVQLFELNGGIGIAALGRRIDRDVIQLTNAYTALGEALGLDWAQSVASRFEAKDPWERLLTAGLARDFEQLRLDFLARQSDVDPQAAVERWVAAQGPRIAQFRGVVDRARIAAVTTAPMLAQIAAQARVLLGR